MDELTILRLLTAASNIDIARGLNAESFLDLLHTIQSSPNVDKETQDAACKLLVRINGWNILEDALSNTQADFSQPAAMMRDIGLEEHSFGIWVGSMINHQGLVAQLAENPVLLKSQNPPLLLNRQVISVSHDEFISFVRAYIGVSCVLAVYAWADSLPHEICRERTLGILRLWQKVDGYREVGLLPLVPLLVF